MPRFQQNVMRHAKKWESMVHTQILKVSNKVGALGQPRWMGWGRSWEGGSGWGAHVYTWLIHVDVCQILPQY